MTRKTGLALLAMLAAFSAAACAPTHSGNTYSRAQAGEEQRVSRGTILAMRDVKVEGTQSGAGVIGGGVLGGVAGSMLGKGSRANLAGAAAGAVLGAVGGSMAESKITEQTSTEFTVREESGAIIAVVQGNEEGLREGDRVAVIRGTRIRIVRDNLPADRPRGS